MKYSLTLAAAVLGVLALSGCASTTATSSAPGASAALQARSDSQVAGTLSVTGMGDGVHVRGLVSGLKPNGVHAFHIHEKGDCSAPDAASAGGHFNPTSQPHGRADHGEHHLGDQDNLHADGKGQVVIDAHFSGVSLDTGAANDVLGKAIVIHADPDDYASQPAGNAGKRIACGVIR